MTVLIRLTRLWEHCRWADEKLIGALGETEDHTAARREYAHLLAAEEVWLSRLEGRPSRQPVWPDLTLAEMKALRSELADGYSRYLGALTEDDLERAVRYVNSAGSTFETPIGEILLHVWLHGQYHRGKVNLLLRQTGSDPAPVDYIGFVRGEPAAVTPVDR